MGPVEISIASASLVITIATWAGTSLAKKMRELAWREEHDEIESAERIRMAEIEASTPPDPKAEERRILERKREWWLEACSMDNTVQQRTAATKRIEEIDKQLLELARRK